MIKINQKQHKAKRSQKYFLKYYKISKVDDVLVNNISTNELVFKISTYEEYKIRLLRELNFVSTLEFFKHSVLQQEENKSEKDRLWTHVYKLIGLYLSYDKVLNNLEKSLNILYTYNKEIEKTQVINQTPLLGNINVVLPS